MEKHILVIDDDNNVLEIFRDILVNEGYKVTILAEVDEIADTMEVCKPDLVIVDFLLQGINGGELCSQIKLNEQTSRIPVILTSAHPKVLLSLGNYHCDEFLEKPFDVGYLTERIKYHLKPASRKRNPLRVI
jgi:DNA-binding response OmpR family regulator